VIEITFGTPALAPTRAYYSDCAISFAEASRPVDVEEDDDEKEEG